MVLTEEEAAHCSSYSEEWKSAPCCCLQRITGHCMRVFDFRLGGGVFLSSGRRRRAAYEPEEQRDAQVSVLSARTHRGANRRSAAHPLPVITEELKLWGVAAGLGLVHMMTVGVSS
ncbi:hypothetical protein NQZ68_000817 [Dissostichus eleginoides]|nr:hypothetical protein NQZ68_000817 [Dissostichus eleginoides]